MSPRRHVVWDAPGEAAQRAQWQAALEAAHGNITRAAAATGISKRHAMWLTRELGLTEHAAQLRQAATGRSTGRPRAKSRA